MEIQSQGINKRTDWIDYIKAICMIGVYILHSEAYYGTGGVSYGYAISPFYVNAFFFVSGYLFFKKHINNQLSMNPKKGCQTCINLFHKIIIPTLIFSTIIYIPKMLFHSNDISIGRYFFDVFGGISFWFTSALPVAQIILLLLSLSKVKNLLFYIVITLALSGLGMYLNAQLTSKTPDDFFPWFYKTGMAYTFVMVCGGIYHRYEKQINSFMRYGWIIVSIIYIGIIFLTWESHEIKTMGLSGSCNPMGAIAIISGVTTVIAITKRMKNNISLLQFIGKNSIIFYFFSGVIPATCGTTVNQMGFKQNYGMTLLIAAISLGISYGITMIIVKYIPFLTDLRKTNFKKDTHNHD